MHVLVVSWCSFAVDLCLSCFTEFGRQREKRKPIEIKMNALILCVCLLFSSSSFFVKRQMDVLLMLTLSQDFVHFSQATNLAFEMNTTLRLHHNYHKKWIKMSYFNRLTFMLFFFIIFSGFLHFYNCHL